MSSYAKLNSVSKTLVNLIWNGIKNDTQITEIIDSENQISTASVKEAKDSKISIYLYNITEYESMRNWSPTPQKPSPLVNLKLHYLITPCTLDSEKDQLILGKIIQLLAENPVIRGPALQGSLAGSNLDLRITLDPLSIDDIYKLWSILSMTYRLSLSYCVYPVTMESTLTKEEILSLCNKYDVEEDQWDPELETHLGERLRTNKEMTKDDLIQIVKWKFITNKHRLKRELNLIEKAEDGKIKQLTRVAFNTDNELLKIKCLMKIKGIGNAVASAILTFYDPKNYGVFDIHIYDELFGTTPTTRPSNMGTDPKVYIKLLEKLREIANKHNLNVRAVEKAYFKKNLDEGK